MIIIGPHNILPEKEVWACNRYGIDLAKEFDADLKTLISTDAIYISSIKEFSDACDLEGDPSLFRTEAMHGSPPDLCWEKNFGSAFS